VTWSLIVEDIRTIVIAKDVFTLVFGDADVASRYNAARGVGWTTAVDMFQLVYDAKSESVSSLLEECRINTFD